jgi:hypothetical protein
VIELYASALFGKATGVWSGWKSYSGIFKKSSPRGILASKRKDQRVQAHADNDERTDGKEYCPQIMAFRRSQGVGVEQTGADISVHQSLRSPKRRLGQGEQKNG